MISLQSGNRKSTLQTSSGGTKVSVLRTCLLLVCIVMVARSSKSSQNTKVNPSPKDSKFEPQVKRTQKLATSLAHLKEKKRLLSNYGDIDMFTSLRPKIGKRYSDPSLEEKRLNVLEECRSRLLPISVAEVDQEIADVENEFRSTFKSMAASQMTHKEYLKASNDAWKAELVTSQKIRKNHDRKINHFVKKLNVQFKAETQAIKPEKKVKHVELKRLRNKERNWIKNIQRREKKSEEMAARIEIIKQSNLVHNLSSVEVPDSAYAFLALGSSFVPSKMGTKHDDVYDIKLFSRKMRWKAFFRIMPELHIENGLSDTEVERLLKVPDKLKPKNLEMPSIRNKHLEEIIEKLSAKVEGYKKKIPSTNLTHLEVEGLRWCKKMVKDKKLYFSKVDKGGVIVILDAHVVDRDIRDTLGNTAKYTKLEGDPRSRIKSEINDMIEKLVADGVLTLKDRLFLTGRTEKGGYSHDHSFYVNAPYIYPLYKIHKLNASQIAEKVIPPTRMVTSGVRGPTYRIGVFLDSVLKPVSEEYCRGELVKDTTEFLQRLKCSSDSGDLSGEGLNLVAMDICALYPSIKIDVALIAVRDALNKKSEYSDKEKDAIISLLRYTLRNSVVHYREDWFQSAEGAPTGNPEVPSVANIFVKYVIDQKILPHHDVYPLNKMSHRARFLDDIWGTWGGSPESFKLFLEMVNKVGEEFGVTFTGDCGKSVEFLDVTTRLENGSVETTMYVKPTDCTRYLNRRSYHSRHTFRGMPYSQFRRAAAICSETADREYHVRRMEQKFVDSGFRREDLRDARDKALALDRMDLLSVRAEKADNQEVLTCVINYDPDLKRELNQFFKDHEQELQRALGDIKLVVSERRHANTSSLLFKKRGFSQKDMPTLSDQRCLSKRCKTRSTMNLDKTVLVNGKPVKLDFRCNCSTESIIYVAICKICSEENHNNVNNFYFGQTVNSLMSRCNGHRDKFKPDRFDQSALSMHVMDCHVEEFGSKLNNFDFGVVKSVNPIDLDRAEDCLIYSTKADIVGLNRYKVSR